ncbi:hypothetical protein CR513_04463, partial [Mucuna pruriens]
MVRSVLIEREFQDFFNLKLSKLDDKSTKCVLLGVSGEFKAYKIYDPINKKIHIRRDVKFQEDVAWDWGESKTNRTLDANKLNPMEESCQAAEEVIQTSLNDAATTTSKTIPNSSSNLLDLSPRDVEISTEGRARKPPAWMKDYVTGDDLTNAINFAMIAIVDLVTYNQASKSQHWRDAMAVEIQAIQRNDTWELVNSPPNCKIVGYTQEEEIDYIEIFSPVARLEIIRIVVALAATKRWSIYQLDIKSAFLHGKINEDVYKLKKVLHGLKQAPRAWYSKLQSHLVANNLLKCPHEHTLFIKKEGGMKLLKTDQGAEVDSTLFKQLVRSLMYLTATRPDITHSVSLISCFMEHLKDKHFLAANHILRYLQGTQNLGIFYKDGGNEELFAYTDSDYAGDFDDRKSTSGYAFMLGGGVLSWASKKQPVVSLFTTEAEFTAATLCAYQCVWLRRILEHLDYCHKGAIVMFCDNASTIKLTKNSVFHGRNKLIDVRFYFLRDLCNDGIIQLNYCSTREQLVDIMTKSLKVENFRHL